MLLKQFRIQNFRSINDSGVVEVEKITTLVGRNESGKTNLLLGLASLNPPGGIKKLNPIKDFPRGRRLEECTDETPLVSSVWSLTPAESKALSDKLGANQNITTVEINRTYKAEQLIELTGAVPPTIEATDAKKIIRKIEPALNGMAAQVPDEQKKQNVLAAIQKLTATNDLLAMQKKWAAGFIEAAKLVRTRVGEAAIVIDDAIDDPLAELEATAMDIANYDTKRGEARALVAGWLPTFIFTPEFPELNGHQDLDQFVNRRKQVPALIEAENNFEKLAQVADFKPAELHARRVT
jgi:hypothetical protein